MSFTYPSLKEISQQVLGDLKEAIGDPKYFMGASPLQALAYAVSGVSYMLHAHIDHVGKYQLMPDTAKGEDLDRWASILNIPPRFNESKSTGFVTLDGLETTSLGSDLKLISSTGQEYQVSRNGAKFKCESVQTGIETNLAPTDLLFQKNSKINVMIDPPGIAGGRDVESDEELRSRILSRISHPSRGGTRTDFIQWVMNLEEAGAGKVWVYPAYPQAGSVGVTFTTKSYKTPFPTQDQLGAAQTDLSARIPLGTTVQVFPLLKKEITFKLEFIEEAYAAIAQDAIARLLFDCAHPETTLTVSKIQNTLAIALKGDHFSLIGPTQDIAFALGEFGTIGAFTWNHVNSLSS